MSGNKCRNCGSTNIETDPGRGDAICIECGFVLEDSVIISQTTFEESSSGKVRNSGFFVGNDSTGGATNFGAPYYANGKESRGITIQNARKGITHLCLQLGITNQSLIDISVNFYKMALNHHLTRGRKQVHNQAACVYITCRIEKTQHMLIDISDVLHICVHELGRTYLRFTQALCINIPVVDPCIYIMRFAYKLEFGDDKTTQAVSNTAIRIVKRMKRDSIHSGRRPSGLCGAALLIAARLHEFNRSTADIIKIVKVHESTLRKRLMEFGDTPSSALTLDEFMTVDLEEEQDPPAFKAARKKDKERLQKLENIDAEISELQAEIDRQLEDYRIGKVRKRKDVSIESEDADRFIRESNLSIIQQYVENNIDDPDDKDRDAILDENNSLLITGLGPDIASMMSANDHLNESKEKDNYFENSSEEIYTNDIDDEELDSYILSEKESQSKSALWNKVNADYLVQQKEKEEKRLKEKEEGKPEKKRRRTTSKKHKMPANTAGEAIEKMLQEKKISSKINYEVLKNLNNQQQNSQDLPVTNTSELDTINFKKPITVNSTLKSTEVLSTKKYPSIKPNTQQLKKSLDKTLDKISRKEEEFTKKEINSMELDTPIVDTSEIGYDNDDYLDEEESDATEMSLGQMLESRATSESEFCDDGYEYE